jgi:hypothetical protein
MLNGLRVGTDLNYLGSSLFNENVSQYEINGDLDLNRYLVNYAFGIADFQRIGESFAYETTGSYFKAGLDVNFINNLEGNNAVFVGLRYAQSGFSANLERSFLDGNGEVSQVASFEENDLSSSWFEGLVGIKVNVWQNIHMGFTVSNRFLNSISGEDDLLAYEVPGFGLAEAGSLWRFNYKIQYYIPFRKQKDLDAKPANQ